MIFAAMENDSAAVSALGKQAGVPPEVVKEIQLKIKKNIWKLHQKTEPQKATPDKKTKQNKKDNPKHQVFFVS